MTTPPGAVTYLLESYQATPPPATATRAKNFNILTSPFLWELTASRAYTPFGGGGK
jgi:hypothetical protein